MEQQQVEEVKIQKSPIKSGIKTQEVLTASSSVSIQKSPIKSGIKTKVTYFIIKTFSNSKKPHQIGD